MMVVSVTAAIRVAVEISMIFCMNCMFCGGIYDVGCCSGVSDIGWILMVVVVMVMYLWSSDGDCGDDGCCYACSCDKE